MTSEFTVSRIGASAHEGLRQVRLLQGLPEDVLADVARACRFKLHRARREVIARASTERDCHFVLSGRLRVVAFSPAGRAVSFRDVGAGDLIGEFSALDGKPRSASVVALSESLVARLSEQVLLQLLQRHWPICHRLLVHLAETTRELTERVYELSTLGVQQRLGLELLRLALVRAGADDAVTLAPAPSHSELAARIGSVREQVTRELAELERQGLVVRGEGRLHLPSLPMLSRHVQGRREAA